MSTATKPILLNETYSDKMDELKSALVTAINGVSLGNYVICNVNNYAWGSVLGAGLFPPGSQVNLTATPATGCSFVAYTDANGNVLTTNTTYSFFPTGNTVIQAIFSVSSDIPTIVPWATGTDQQLKAMLDAHYEGVIDIHDFWKVGDTRLSEVSAMGTMDGIAETHGAQQLEWVLMDAVARGYVPTDDSISAFAFVVGMKDSLKETGTIGALYGPLWGSSHPRLLWCNSIFKSAVPDTLLPIFKEARFALARQRAPGTDSYDAEKTFQSLEVMDAYFTFASITDVVGDDAKIVSEEKALYKQFSYYETAENRVKKRSSRNAAWFTASGFTGESNHANYIYISNAGAATSSGGGGSQGLSMIGFI